MSFATDIAADYAIFDTWQPATVTLRQKRASGQTATATINNPTSGPLSRSQLQAPGVTLQGNEVSWSLNATDAGTLGVEVGDEIDDGTDVWTIIACDKRTLGTRWKCIARKQAPSTE